MRDLISIIIAERKTLLRGLTISFLLTFPITFIPTISKNGFNYLAIRGRMHDSTIYALGFSLVVVIVAVLHNYNNLVDRKKLFDKPAFTNLDFYGRLDGFGSTVHELETFLLGKIGDYYFRLNIIDPELKKFKIQIVPYIDIEDDDDMKEKLKKELSFKNVLFFGQIIELTDTDLADKDFLLTRIADISATLTRLQVRQFEIDESLLLD